MEKAPNMDAYIATFPASTQKLLQSMRKLIHQMAPDATETISYAMPAFKQKKMLVYFAAYQHHIGFYPGAATIHHFKKEIATYKHAKGSVQFPLTQPLPLELIKNMVAFKLKNMK